MTNNKDLKYRTAVDGFVTNVDGFLCFIIPQVANNFVEYRWTIESGGGWTHRGGADVVTHFEGIAFTSSDAEKQIIEALENNLNGSVEDNQEKS